MQQKKWTVLAVAAACLTSLPDGVAQHRDDRDRGSVNSRRGIRITTPLGDIVTDFKDYRFVVPQEQDRGSFYAHQDKHYYVPPPSPHRGERRAQRPLEVEFGAYEHHDELVQRLERLANQLCLEMHYNYRHNRGYRQTYREAYELWQDAKRAHEDVHRNDRRSLQRRALAFDELFHHIEEDVAGWSGSNRRRVGQLDLHGKLEEMEAVIHHLLFDLGVNPEHDEHHDEEPPPPDLDVPPRPRSR